MSKCTRSLSLILILILSFSLFSVNAFAVDDENLVDGNMSNWVDFGDESPYFQSADVTFLGDSINYIEIPSNSTTVLLFDLTQFLKIGDSYRFAFNLPTTNGYNSSSLTSCVLTWALCDGSGDDYPTVGNNVFEINIDDTNKSKYLGKTTVFEFTYTQGFQNTFLCLFVSHGDNVEVYEDLELYISDISLERVTSENEKKLDGILGWLESIWDSITSLGDKLTDVWTNITSSVSALGDRISSFFSDLGNKITTEFTNLTSDFSGYISSLGDRFSGFITSLGDRISGYFENLSVNINAFFDDLLEGIKDFFRGFGNLILYFNWEGEYTNPFESSNSIIGGGSEDSEDIIEPIYNVNLEDFYSKENNFSFTFLENGDFKILKTNQGSSNGYCCLKILVPSNSTCSISFDLVDYYLVGSGAEYFAAYISTDEYAQTNNVNRFVDFFNLNKSTPSLPFNCFYEFPVSDTDTVYYLTFFCLRKSSYYPKSYVTISNFDFYCSLNSSIGGSSSSGVDIQSSLDNVLEYLSTITIDIENVMDSITGSIELFDKFCEEFPFIKALCIFVLALLIYSTVIGL